MLAQEQSGCLVFNRLSFLLLETSSSGSLCPASMHWHHLNGLAGVGYIRWKRACQASSSFIFPSKWTELRCEENVDTFDPEDTGSLE